MDSQEPPRPPQIPLPPTAPPSRAPQPERRSNGWMFVSLILFGMLLIVGALWLSSAMSRLLQGGGSGPGGGGRRFQEVWIDRQDSPHKIAVISVEGMITASGPGHHNMVTAISDQLDRAAEDEAVKAVVLKVNSPGGEVLASDDIHLAIREFQAESGKPVVASMGSLAASGGYYVAAPCRWIVANPLTITGSIGVIMSGYNYRGLMDKVGLRPEVYKSGRFKDMLRGSKLESEISDEERAMVQQMVDETYARFKEVVSEGRTWAASQNRDNQKNPGKELIDSWASYADGRILSGKQAYELGFVDELGNLESAKERAKSLAGIGSASVIEYQQLLDFSSFLRLFGQAKAKDIKIDLGVTLPKLEAGQLYFLSPTYLQ